MTSSTPGISNASIDCVLAGQLDASHLGRQVAFYSLDGARVHGVLRSARPRGFTATVLTLDGDRHWHITPTTEVDVITQEATT